MSSQMSCSVASFAALCVDWGLKVLDDRMPCLTIWVLNLSHSLVRERGVQRGQADGFEWAP